MGTHPTPLPVVCTLGPSDLEERSRAWKALISDALRAKETTGDGVRLHFEPAAAERVRELALAETDCCAWARWEVQRQPDGVVLEVSASGDGAAVVRQMFA